MLAIPPNFSKAIVDVHGNVGREWLVRLPVLLQAIRERWQLQLGPPFEHTTYSYLVGVALKDGTPAVLKASVPGRAVDLEAAALRAFAGRGVVRLLHAETDSGVLLLERLEPGTSLSDIQDDAAATRAAIAVMREIRTPAPLSGFFPTTAEWAAGLARLRSRFGGGTGPFPTRLVVAAERVFEELHASATESELLHGDLHHGNILAATRHPWLAVDPKGVIGEPAYEVGALLRNPMPALLRTPNPRVCLARRVAQLSDELEIDRYRVAGYAFAQAVLASWWQFEDHGAGEETWMRGAEMLRELIR